MQNYKIRAIPLWICSLCMACYGTVSCPSIFSVLVRRAALMDHYRNICMRIQATYTCMACCDIVLWMTAGCFCLLDVATLRVSVSRLHWLPLRVSFVCTSALALCLLWKTSVLCFQSIPWTYVLFDPLPSVLLHMLSVVNGLDVTDILVSCPLSFLHFAVLVSSL